MLNISGLSPPNEMLHVHNVSWALFCLEVHQCFVEADTMILFQATTF